MTARQLITQVTEMQDHLGLMNDADVAAAADARVAQSQCADAAGALPRSRGALPGLARGRGRSVYAGDFGRSGGASPDAHSARPSGPPSPRSSSGRGVAQRGRGSDDQADGSVVMGPASEATSGSGCESTGSAQASPSAWTWACARRLPGLVSAAPVGLPRPDPRHRHNRAIRLNRAFDLRQLRSDLVGDDRKRVYPRLRSVALGLGGLQLTFRLVKPLAQLFGLGTSRVPSGRTLLRHPGVPFVPSLVRGSHPWQPRPARRDIVAGSSTFAQRQGWCR